MFPAPRTLLLLALCHWTTTASTVIVYTDAECKTAAANLTAPNGYPDGECTDVSQQTSKSFQSFQFLSLDADCTPTVYQASDEDDCAGEAIVASLGTCYNTSWVDYSVDGCTAATSSSSSAAPSVVLPTTTAATAAVGSSSSSSSSSSSTGSAPSATASEGGGASVRGLARAGSAGGVCAALVAGMLLCAVVARL